MDFRSGMSVGLDLTFANVDIEMVTYILLGCVYWNALACGTLEYGTMTM